MNPQITRLDDMCIDPGSHVPDIRHAGRRRPFKW
jgi:hypothetical protein